MTRPQVYCSDITRPSARPASLRTVAALAFTLAVAMAVAVAPSLHAQDAPSVPDEGGFGIKTVELGIGIAPLGLTDENDLDVFTEYGGFVTVITKNPDNIMLRLGAAYGTSKVSAPTDFLSEGSFSITRFEASLLYGSYVYGGVGIGYYQLKHELSSGAEAYFLNRGQQATESFDNTTGYSLRLGIRSEGTLGYFVEGTLTFMKPNVHATVTDLRTGNSAARTEPFKLNIFHFFHLGLVYRF